jgi:hypothetical protein
MIGVPAQSRNEGVAGEEVPTAPDLVMLMLDEMAKEDGKR